jgi:glycosyltransferase involved in cell wall biosynthesis
VVSRARARFLLKQFSAYLAVGTRSRQYLRAMGTAEPAIVSSPHAVDNEAFRLRASAARQQRLEIRKSYGFSEEQRVIVFAGKLTAIKRPADVIDAAAGLDKGAVLFVGEGPERSALEARARDRNVHVVFAGFLNQQYIANAYVAADALMMPGRETWGLVVNEALACGLPAVLSSDVGAGADLSTPKACVIVDRNDAGAYARALRSLLELREADSQSVARECEAVIRGFSFAAATAGLVTAARFAVRNSRPAATTARARVVALCGNFVFAGGMERMTFEALDCLRSGGADVHALLNGWSSRPIAALAERSGSSWEVGHYNARLDGVFRHPLRMFRASGDVLRASVHLASLLWRRRITHVFAADFRAVLAHAPALLVCRVVGVPVILRCGVAPTPTRAHKRLWRWLIRPVVSRYVANSAFTATELRVIGVPESQLATIFNIVPRRTASPTVVEREANRVCYVGQIIPEKGVLQLIEAIGLLVARGLDVHLDLVGEMDGWAPPSVDAYRALIRARVARADVRERVNLLGWREDVDTVLRRASVHCCPSQPEQREAFGITVVEAKRTGVPSVVCPSGALPELITHKCDGWVTDSFGAASIAEGIEWLLEDRERLAEVRRAALGSGRRFDPAEFARRWQREFGLQQINEPSAGAAGTFADLRVTP